VLHFPDLAFRLLVFQVDLVPDDRDDLGRRAQVGRRGNDLQPYRSPFRAPDLGYHIVDPPSHDILEFPIAALAHADDPVPGIHFIALVGRTSLYYLADDRIIPFRLEGSADALQ